MVIISSDLLWKWNAFSPFLVIHTESQWNLKVMHTRFRFHESTCFQAGIISTERNRIPAISSHTKKPWLGFVSGHTAAYRGMRAVKTLPHFHWRKQSLKIYQITRGYPTFHYKHFIHSLLLKQICKVVLQRNLSEKSVLNKCYINIQGLPPMSEIRINLLHKLFSILQWTHSYQTMADYWVTDIHHTLTNCLTSRPGY